MIILVGTSHSIQVDLVETNSGASTRAFLEKLCVHYKVAAIAEEMNSDALMEKNVEKSIPMVVANQLNITHKCCDPDLAMRLKLGIRQENDVKIEGLMNNRSEGEIEERIRMEYQKREVYWLSQFKDLNHWPLLFVCGANHVNSFSELVKQEGLEVKIGASDWDPEITNDTSIPYQ